MCQCNCGNSSMYGPVDNSPEINKLRQSLQILCEKVGHVWDRSTDDEITDYSSVVEKERYKKSDSDPERVYFDRIVRRSCSVCGKQTTVTQPFTLLHISELRERAAVHKMGPFRAFNEIISKLMKEKIDEVLNQKEKGAD